MNKQHKIKGLFFDFDGVITIEKQGSPTIISYISKEANIPIEVVENAYYKHNDEKNTWEFDYAIDRPYKVYRKDEVLSHLAYLEKKETEFMEINIKGHKRPKAVIRI